VALGVDGDGCVAVVLRIDRGLRMANAAWIQELPSLGVVSTNADGA